MCCEWKKTVTSYDVYIYGGIDWCSLFDGKFFITIKIYNVHILCPRNLTSRNTTERNVPHMSTKIDVHRCSLQH